MVEVNFRLFDPTQKTYFKRNYSKALESIVPTVYMLKDFEVSGLELDPLDEILKTHLLAAENISTLLPISATPNFAAINTISGISPFFVKQNQLTRVSPFTFERDILDPLGFQMEAFETSGEWRNYLESDLLPSIRLNDFTRTIPTPSGLTQVSSAYGFTGSALHEYYINSLGWFYLLNTSAVSPGSYNPSSYVLDKFSELFIGKSVDTQDGIVGFEEYLWRNYPTLPSVSSLGLIPPNYLSGTEQYTSGTQELDRLKTLLTVLYSRGFADNKDFKVKETFEDYITLGSFSPAEENAGPFNKLLRVLGYVYQDLNSSVEKLESLYEIDTCPEEFLPHLSQLIGWDLIGSDSSRWRSQIKNALRIYKSKGTTKSTQLALTTLFGDTGFSLSSSMYELHESYVPFLVYYLIATGSPYFNKAGYKEDPFELWTPELALAKGVTYSDTNGTQIDYSTSSMDSNIRRCVDKVIRDVWTAHSQNFVLGNTTFPTPGSEQADQFKFFYRDRVYDIPPFEEIRYYEKAQITEPVLDTLYSSLYNLDVSADYITHFIKYVGEHTVSSVDNISVGNSFVMFTSGFQEPFNFTAILNDISNTKSEYLSLWNAKSSHFDLHLSANATNFSKKVSNPDTSLGITDALLSLNKTIPAHAIPRVKIFLEIFDDVSNFLYACPRPMLIHKDIVLSSTVVNAWDASGVNMGEFYSELGLGHGLSATNISRPFVNSVTDMIMDGAQGDTTKGAYVPRNNLRRRNLYQEIPRNGVFDRTGFNMPNSYAPSTFDPFGGASGVGSLTLGYNYSGCDFQTPFTDGRVSSLHPVWHSCETSSSHRRYFGIDSSTTFPWRGALAVTATLAQGGCLDYVRREELPEIMRVMHRTKEKDAYKAAYLNFKDVSADWQTSNTWMDPVQSLANSAYNGVSSWYQYADYTFGSGVHEAYNRYAREFGRHGTAPYLVSGFDAHGGRSIFSHIYGPLLYNGKFTKDGSGTEFIASSLTQTNYQGIGYTDLSALGAQVSAGSCTDQLVYGWPGACTRGEIRYPHALSGIEYCYYVNQYNNATPNGAPPESMPRYQTYRTTPKYARENPNINPFLTNKGLLDVHVSGTSTFSNWGHLRFDLNPYGSSETSGNRLIPDHDYEVRIKIAKCSPGATSVNTSLYTHIHTMPESKMFWSWQSRSDRHIRRDHWPKTWRYSDEYSNGEWVACSGFDQIRPLGDAGPGDDFQYGVQNSLAVRAKSIPTVINTTIDQLEEDNFTEIIIPFNTRNTQFRKSGDFMTKPIGYEPAMVHRNDQHYVMEILIPANQGIDHHFVFENISIIDKTLETTTLDEFSVEYVKDDGSIFSKDVTRTGVDDYRIIFKYMNNLATSSLGDGYGCRIAADTSSVFETSGGSRLNYRYHPKWGFYQLHQAAPDTGTWTTTPTNYNTVDFKEGSSPQENSS